jgi:uncharacterized protein YutE (UPF0331/DUF86 family)
VGQVIDSELIYRKLAELERYTEQLKKHQGITVKKLENDLDQLWIIEHGLQLCIQLVLDIGNHIIAAEGLSINEYADIFPALAKLEVIPEEYTLSIKGMPGLRNILVHEYSELDENILIDVINNRLEDFVLFSRFIIRFLQK